MTMTIDNQQRHHLSSMGFDHMPYSGPPQFSNPWTAASSASTYPPSLSTSNLHYDPLPKQAPRPATISMPYSSMPATSAPMSNASYSSVPYGQPDLLSSSQDLINQRAGYDQAYSSAPSQATSYTSAGSYAPIASYGHSLAQQQHEQQNRRLSSSASSLHQNTAAFGEALDGARGMVAMSQTDITPRNIYGPRSHRDSTDSYGFPSTHSTHSSISSSSGYPNYFGGSVDSSVTDYSSASESLDGVNPSRTLPRPSGLVATGLPPAPQSMMGQFNSKVSSSSQKKHKCKVCDKRFTRPSSLQTHMYSHTGEKPFACDFPGCGRQFSVVSNLRRHRKVHKGDRTNDEADSGSPEGSWASHE